MALCCSSTLAFFCFCSACEDMRGAARDAISRSGNVASATAAGCVIGPAGCTCCRSGEGGRKGGTKAGPKKCVEGSFGKYANTCEVLARCAGCLAAGQASDVVNICLWSRLDGEG